LCLLLPVPGTRDARPLAPKASEKSFSEGPGPSFFRL
jgi:hypothetical protein